MSKLKNFIRNNLLSAIIGGLIFGASGVIADTLVESNDVNYNDTSDVKTAVDDLYRVANIRVDDIKNEIKEETKQEIKNEIYPVGSIYISETDSTVQQVENRFGGKWQAYGQGRTLIGVGSNGTTNYDTVGATGGSETKTIAVGNLPAHSHSVNINTNSTNHNHGTVNTTSTNHSHGTINTTNTGAHVHTIEAPSGHKWGVDYSQWSYGNGSVITPFKFAPSKVNDAGAGYGNDYAKAASAGAHTHQVTINNSGAHTHKVTINNSGAHTHNVNGNTGSTGSGTALNVQNPYITVYMWKRTA